MCTNVFMLCTECMYVYKHVCMYICMYACDNLDGYRFKRDQTLTVLDQVGGHKVTYIHTYIHTYNGYTLLSGG